MPNTTQTLEMIINGRAVRADNLPPETTLLNFLRDRGLTGSKEGCAEGDCGACTVALLDTRADGSTTWRSANSCLLLLPSLAGREILTVEGMAAQGVPHPAQQAMVDHYGSQCGYCTPGFVASMFEGCYREGPDPTSAIANQLCGNLCRCTGYRPIREAMVSARQRCDEQEGDPFRERLKEPAPQLHPVDFEGAGRRFYRPTTVEELLDLMRRHPNSRLLGGATEIGVEVNKRMARPEVLIATEGVDELRRIVKSDSEWRIRGGATLTSLEEVLAGEFPILDKMLNVFASRAIRNRATLAGNLVTASPIGDMAPVLLALDAAVVLRSAEEVRTVPLSDFFVSYRRTVMRPGEILFEIILPRRQHSRADSYKVSKRRDLDISIVAAAFCLDLDEGNLVKHARLAYGGVAATPARALQAEEALIGRAWTQETVEDIATLLEQAFTPMSDVRSGAEFRRVLVVSLFRKFFDQAESLALDVQPTFETGKEWPEPGTSRALKHDSAMAHATGRAVYVDDQAHQRAMLEVWPVCSPHARARVLRIDTSTAAAMPGVVTVLTAADIPAKNDVGAVRHDETLLAAEDVMFHGHMVALVVGESYAACRAAAALVVVDYEPLEPILTIGQSIRQDSFHTEPHRIQRGDCQATFPNCPHVLEGDLATGGQEHLYLEAQAAWAECGDGGDINIVSSTQHPTEIQGCVSHMLGIPRHQVVVEVPRMGGAFGGKETQGNTWAAVVALAAWKTKRAVRIQLDRDLDMQLTGKRHPFWSRYRVGFDQNGSIQALWAEVYSNGGWALDLSESILDRALFHLDNIYYLPNVDITGRVCKTNLVSFTAFRGFGGPQGMLVIEEVMDRVARHLGLPPEDVRRRNMYHGEGETCTTHYGMQVEDSQILPIWNTLREQADFDRRRQGICAWNASHPMIKRGIAITGLKFGISFTVAFLNQAGALVHIYRDGSVQVNHGGTEMGQGLYTKIKGIAMRELGVPSDRVRVMKTSTEKVPNTGPTAASAGADLNGAAVAAACRILRERLHPVAVRMLAEHGVADCDPERLRFEDFSIFSLDQPDVRVSFELVVDRAWFDRISLSSTGFYQTPGLNYVKATGKGRPFHYFAAGAAVCEVEVDGYTGMKQVLRVDILHDVGDSLNPGIDRGQIEGGFVQGMGWLTGEELAWDDRGRLLTHSASTYQIPAFSDAPMVLNVELWGGNPQRTTIHGSKAVGEPPLMLAMAVREALKDAVGSFGEPGGEVLLACPATHEAIYRALQQRLKLCRLVPQVA